MKTGTKEFKIKRLTKKDVTTAQQLFPLLQQVFEVENPAIATNDYVTKLLKNIAFVCFAAIYNNEVVGGLTAYELPMYHPPCSELFIYDIGVKPEFQRMGLGKQLVAAVKEYGNEKDMKQLFVDASEADGHAVNFYRSMNGKEEKVVQFTFDTN